VKRNERGLFVGFLVLAAITTTCSVLLRHEPVMLVLAVVLSMAFLSTAHMIWKGRLDG